MNAGNQDPNGVAIGGRSAQPAHAAQKGDRGQYVTKLENKNPITEEKQPAKCKSVADRVQLQHERVLVVSWYSCIYT